MKSDVVQTHATSCPSAATDDQTKHQTMCDVRDQANIIPKFFFFSSAAIPLQPSSPTGLPLRPRTELHAGGQLCQWLPAAQRCPHALAELRWTALPLEIPAGA